MSKGVLFQQLRQIFQNFRYRWSTETWLQKQKMPFYAVAKGRSIGIFTTWADCEAQVKGFSGAKYKKFDSVVSAEEFISSDRGSNGSNDAYNKASNSYKSYAATSNDNLKRSYSTTSSNNQKSDNSSRSNPSSSRYEDEDSGGSEFDDDLNTILNKQMDDIEKRLKTFEKGVDKIIKKGTKSSGRSTILIEPPQPKRARKSINGFEEDDEGYVQVYTDGACSANGQKSARAGIGVFWGEGHSHNVSEPVSGRATNNCGEIQAATRAIQQAIQSGVKKLTVNTDSQFLINSVTKWMPGWKKKGWKLPSGDPVKNEKDFKELDSIKNKLALKWNYVEAHRGIHGNEMADQLAKAGAALYNNKR